MHRYLQHVRNFFFRVLWAVVYLSYFSPKHLHAQSGDYRSAYSTFAIGDTLALLNPDANVQCQIYLFVNATSCITCELALSAISRLQSQSGVPVVMFLAGEHQAYADEQRKQNGFAFQVIGDPLYLYQKNYGVRHLPFFYLTDGHGKILLMDKIAGTQISYDSLKQTISKISTAKASTSKEAQTVTVHHANGEALKIGKNRYACAFTQSSNIAILDAALKTVYLLDSAGLIVSTIDLSKQPGVSMLANLFWYKPDSVLMIQQMDVFAPHTSVLYTLNINTKQVERLQYNSEKVSADLGLLDVAIEPHSGIIYGGVTLWSDKQLGKSWNSVMQFDAQGTYQREFGNPDTLFVNHMLYGRARPRFAFDEQGNVYEWQVPTSVINVYNPTGKLLRSIKLSFGNTWKPFNYTNFPREGDAQGIIDFNTNTSQAAGLFICSRSNTLTVAYHNIRYPEGDLDPRSPAIERYPYIHRESLDGKKRDIEDIALPKNMKTIDVTDEVVIGMYPNGNALSIIRFPMKQLEDISTADQ